MSEITFHLSSSRSHTTNNSFLLVFLVQVANMSPNLAGAVILAGQIADAVATPIVGRLSDKTPARWHRRKLWLGIGALIVNASFFFIFSECYACSAWTSFPPVVWYSVWASLFNIGWASLQVAHMALIPDLTGSDGERTRLNSARYAGCIAATLLMLLITTLCFRFIGLNQKAFRISSLLAISVGDLFTIVFMFGVPEPLAPRAQKAVTDVLTGKKKQKERGSIPSTPTSPSPKTVEREEMEEEEEMKPYKWYEWFKFPALYQVGVIYMCARAAGNLSQVYLPFYIQRCLSVDQSDVLAEVPAVLMIVSFILTFALRAMNKVLGRMLTFAIGTIFIIAACVSMIFLSNNVWWLIFGVAVLLGIGTTITLVTAISAEADLVGAQIQSGAFVYGLLSLADKLLNGILIVILTPYTSESLPVLAIMTAVPAGSCILALFSAISVPTYWRQLSTIIHERYAAKEKEKDPLLRAVVEDGEATEVGPDDLPPVSQPFLAVHHMSGTIPSVGAVASEYRKQGFRSLTYTKPRHRHGSRKW